MYIKYIYVYKLFNTYLLPCETFYVLIIYRRRYILLREISFPLEIRHPLLSTISYTTSPQNTSHFFRLLLFLLPLCVLLQIVSYFR